MCRSVCLHERHGGSALSADHDIMLFKIQCTLVNPPDMLVLCCAPQNQMVADVLGHLRAISGQQSKIRGLRNKLAILKEAADKQEGATAELLLVRRIPAVYRQCLAECMRRCAGGPPPCLVIPVFSFTTKCSCRR